MTELQVKQKIAGALKAFRTLPLADAASGLLEVLGYTSKKRLALKPNTLATFLATFSQGRLLNDRHALPNEWKSVDFLFQLTDEEVRAAANTQFEFESKGAFNGAIINSYLFIAIELKGEHYSRSALAGITREVNKLFDMPALIFFRHGDTITLAVINRRLHKREPGKDVLEKVTLIQDIRLANTHRAHIEILYDLSLGALHQKYPFTNFVGLHDAWQKTLDTSELNKRFFQDLANWYFWALPQVRFPKNAPKDADGQDSLSLIRLITRVIFCWFLKEKGLLSSALFDEHKIAELLVDLSPKESTYYKNPAKHRKGLMSYRAIADKLDVTPREAEAITEMLRKPFPASSRFEDGTTVTRLAPAGKRDTEALLRRMEIRRLVEGYDVVPSCRKLQHMLLVAGIKAGHVTVMADLKAMQLVGAFCPQGRSEVKEEGLDGLSPFAEGVLVSGERETGTGKR